MDEAVFVVPGRLETATGGYIYDRRIVGGLRDRGWRVAVRELDSSFPHPTPAALVQAADVFKAIPDGALVVVDGLAFGAMPHIAQTEGLRLRLVALVHHPLAEETGIDEAVRLRFGTSERRALAAASRVIVTSRATARLLREYGVGPDRVSVVEPGTDRAALAVGSGGPVPNLLCVATLIPRKRHDVLIRALASIRHLDWRLICAGSADRDPPAAARLRLQVHEAGLEDRVSLVGEVDEAQLAGYYHRADVFVLASQYEGYGMAVAEALARGLPVVATNTGAVSGLVLHSVHAGDDHRASPGDNAAAGILVPPGDAETLASALRHVLGDSSLRARLVEGARRTRGRLRDWAAAASEMAAVLQTGSDGRIQR